MEAFKQKLNDHIENDKLNYARHEKCLEKLQASVDKIESNHLAHLKSELEGIKNDLTWVKKVGWFLIATSVAQVGWLVDQLLINIINK
jgi:hypothetical protein